MKEQGFDSMDELIDNVSRGAGVEFLYKGKAFSITHSKYHIHIMEKNNYSTEQAYTRADDIGDYVVCSEKLKDVITKIEVTYICF